MKFYKKISRSEILWKNLQKRNFVKKFAEEKFYKKILRENVASRALSPATLLFYF